MHPSERILGATSMLLAGKTIVLGVTGSIAAVRTVELARELIRHGARVVPVMSRDAQAILHPNALEFATGTRPIVELTGQVEHVSTDADLLLIAPCTGNTLSKLAHGIDDTPVLTFAANTPHAKIMLAPAMHDGMYENPVLLENLEKLRKLGVRFVEPTFEEHKAKLAEPETIVEDVLRALGPRSLAGKRVLVVNGATQEPLDDMRVVSNRSSGRMGAALAREAYRLGADVEHWFGHGDLRQLPRVPTKRFSSVADLLALAPDTARFDAILVPAAISDFGPAHQKGKLPSEGAAPELKLHALPKFVHELRKHTEAVLVTFKAEADAATLVERARKSLGRAGARFVVANVLSDVEPDRTKALLVDAKAEARVEGSKDEVARAILARLAKELVS